MHKRIIHTILLLSIGICSYGQLLPLLDQYYMNGLAINPAYAGSQEALSVGMYSRVQWLGFDGSPRTYTFSLHSPLRNKKVNMGLIVLGDKLGSKNETGFLMNYAYRIQLGKGQWSLGLAAGITHLTTDLNSVKYTDMGDILLQDPARRAILPDFSVGSYYYTEKFYTGLSMPLFLSQKTNPGDGSYQLNLNFAAANYMFTAGYLFKLSDGIEMLPSLLLKSNPASNTQLDIHCNVILREIVWMGAGIRTNRSMVALLQIQANPQLKIAYSYGYEFSELSSYQHGTHELMLKYNFRYILNVMSPRYF